MSSKENNIDLKQAKSGEESSKKKKNLKITVETGDKTKQSAANTQANSPKKPVTINIEESVSPDIAKSRNKPGVANMPSNPKSNQLSSMSSMMKAELEDEVGSLNSGEHKVETDVAEFVPSSLLKMYTNGGKAKKNPSDNSVGDIDEESRDKMGPLGGNTKVPKVYERPKPRGGLVPRPE